MSGFEKYTDKLIEQSSIYMPKLLLAIITLIIGLWVIKLIVKAFGRTMARSKTDESLQRFITSLARIALKIMLLMMSLLFRVSHIRMKL